jgi:hypothetical protein
MDLWEQAGMADGFLLHAVPGTTAGRRLQPADFYANMLWPSQLDRPRLVTRKLGQLELGL